MLVILTVKFSSLMDVAKENKNLAFSSVKWTNGCFHYYI